ncbi:MAG: hypothetical protein ABSE06_09450 [Anaerolineaceae bacterium]
MTLSKLQEACHFYLNLPIMGQTQIVAHVEAGDLSRLLGKAWIEQDLRFSLRADQKQPVS